jgi:hypothetical protein
MTGSRSTARRQPGKSLMQLLCARDSYDAINFATVA